VNIKILCNRKRE